MKRIVKWLIPCLVACFMVVGLVQTASFVSAEQQEVTPDQNQANVPVPDHTKSISGNEQKGYTLTLDVKGKQEIIPGQKTKVDVVLVIDKSGSMGDENSFDMADPDNPNGPKIRRIEALQKIVTGDNGLSKTILGNQNLDARMAVVTYSGSKTSENHKDNPNNDANIISGWIGNYSESGFIGEIAVSSINTSVKNITTDGGTNCEAGLVKASEALLTSRGDAQKYVIFLSDGTPTYYYANGNDYYRPTKPVWSFAEEAVPENTPNPKENNITPENLGKDVIYGEHTVLENWQLVTKTEWYIINEWDTGWHYIEEEGVGNWKYGKYSYSLTKTYEKGITLGAGDSDSKGRGEIPVPEEDPDGNSNNICSKRAYDAVVNLGGLTGFYTVGVAGNANETFLKTLKDKSTAEDTEYFPGTDTEKLTKAFSDIASSILDRSLTVSNVTITDTLSEYVEFSRKPEDGTVKDTSIKITNADGKDVTSTENALAGMSVSFSGNNVICDFNDGYSLKENYTYSVSFGVVPSQKAYTEFSKNNGSYGVDESGNKLTGFKSNESATLTYKYGDKENSYDNEVSYVEKPEIQVSANKLSVTKEVKGAYANKNDKFNFTLTLKDEEGQPVTETSTFGGVEFKDGKHEFTLTNGQTVEFKNLPRNYTFTLEEEPADGYDTTYSTQIVDTKNNAQSATFTYENKDKIFITVTNTAKDIAITGITDNTPKGLGLIGSIVVEIAAIAFVLKKKRQLKM